MNPNFNPGTPGQLSPQQSPATAFAAVNVATAATATSTAAASAGRKQLMLQNLDASILVYASTASDVSATTGMLLPPRGAPLYIEGPLAQSQWFTIAASGTPAIAVGSST